MSSERTVLLVIPLNDGKKIEFSSTVEPSFPPNKNFFNLNLPTFSWRVVPKENKK